MTPVDAGVSTDNSARPPGVKRVQGAATGNLLLRNTAYLTLSQVVTVPLAILMNAVAARYLGPVAFGYAYLAWSFCSLGFLAVGWGQDSVLPAVVARDHQVAGITLASSLVWRFVVALAVYVVLALGCYALKYPAEVQWAVGLTAVVLTLTYFNAAYKYTIRGLERTDIPALAHVGEQVLATVFVVLVLLLGGGLRACLTAQALAAAATIATLWQTRRFAGIGELTVSWDTMKMLFVSGTPFAIFGIALALQPNVDAIFLSKLAPTEVMGWYAVSRRLLGPLLLPASSLISALYPTLSRLHATDMEEFKRTTNLALRNISLVVIPVALGCGLYPQIGVALFNRGSFRPAEDNLRVLSVFLALMYFSMPLGTILMAAGKQKLWSAVQCICVAISLLLDPLLVPVFQSRTGNGGLGLCVAAVLSEAAVVAFAIAFVPKGIFDRKFARTGTLSLVSGAAMAACAFLASSLGPFMAAPLSLGVYVGTLWLTGGVDETQRKAIYKMAQRFFVRVNPSFS